MYKLKFLLEKKSDSQAIDPLLIGITQELEIHYDPTRGDGLWVASGGGWGGFGETKNESLVSWLHNRLTQDPMSLDPKEEMEDLLRGSYTTNGIERWFQRPRSWLDGKTPQMILDSGDKDLIQKIRNHIKDNL